MDIGDFAGTWALIKDIRDRIGGPAQFRGKARIEREGGAWVYREEGRMKLASGQIIPGTRRYIWQPGPGEIAVLFDDGRPFHALPLAGGTATHDCDPDTYEVAYDLCDMPEEWQAVWTVTGPRKDYEMTCRYRKLP